VTAGWRRVLALLTLAACVAGVVFGGWLYGLLT
jgi:hypothetical protein